MKAHHVLCAKADQSDLLTAIERSFALKPLADTWQQADADHGRMNTRTCTVSGDAQLMPQRERWPGLRSVACCVDGPNRRATGKNAAMSRHFIATLKADAKLTGGQRVSTGA